MDRKVFLCERQMKNTTGNICSLLKENFNDTWFAYQMLKIKRKIINVVEDNHDDVITNLEPDILECEDKRALENITMNKASEFQLSCFKSWKMMLWKCCTQYASKYGKLSSGHRTGKGQFSFQFQRKAMPKNAQTTAQLHSSHMLINAQNSPSQASPMREPWTSRCSS